jgi:dTDP-4-amino-4,6-dideoxygalactose transaminase
LEYSKNQLMNQTLHVGRPNFGSREKFFQRMNQIMDNAWLTNRGPFVIELEQKIATYLGVRHFISMCNGTVALEIAIRALGLTGEVIIPSLTFIATAHALQWQEVQPVFCDIDPISYCIDPKEIERHITPRTTGIIGVHLYGRPCDMDALRTVAEKHDLRLMFDAAHAFGCSYHGKMIGGFGDCEIFSFHATKVFNTFEGGGISTNNDALAEKIRLMQNFGFAGYDNVIYIGINGKMTEISAAMGLTNFECIDEFIETNRMNYQAYRECMQNINGIKLMEYDESNLCNWQYVVAEVGDDYPLKRDELIKKLQAENILVRRYFWPGCHKMEPYRSYYPNAGLLLSNTERIASRLVVFPTGTAVNEEIVRRICNLL